MKVKVKSSKEKTNLVFIKKPKVLWCPECRKSVNKSRKCEECGRLTDLPDCPTCGEGTDTIYICQYGHKWKIE